MVDHPAAGRILDRADILARLKKNQIFRAQSWSEACLRSAAYDLRMATDFMVVPDRPTYPAGRFYARETHRERAVVLMPGDVAFVSTVEKCCVPWDITGTIGAKFSLTARGLLILTGMFVDPGYGLVTDPEKEWIAADDQRLHFLIANVGSSDVVLKPGEEKIASIQFASTSTPKELQQVRSKGLSAIEEQHLNPETATAAGLVFFRNVAELKTAVDANTDKNAEFERRLSGVEAGSNQVVMFGVFLLCFTFLGILFQEMLNIAGSEGLTRQFGLLSNLISKSLPGLSAGLIVTVLASIGVVAIIKVLFRLLAKR
jgi:deoxycytidine triphosphate deaminase